MNNSLFSFTSRDFFKLQKRCVYFHASYTGGFDLIDKPLDLNMGGDRFESPSRQRLS